MIVCHNLEQLIKHFKIKLAIKNSIFLNKFDKRISMIGKISEFHFLLCLKSKKLHNKFLK